MLGTVDRERAVRLRMRRFLEGAMMIEAEHTAELIWMMMELGQMFLTT